MASTAGLAKSRDEWRRPIAFDRKKRPQANYAPGRAQESGLRLFRDYLVPATDPLVANY